MPLVRVLLCVALTATACTAQSISFRSGGATNFGFWSVETAISAGHFYPRDELTIHTALTISRTHLKLIANSGQQADALVLLMTAERTFDSNGWFRLPSEERMSSLLTPAGLPIEGGIPGAVTDRYGYPFRTPVDLFAIARLPAPRGKADAAVVVSVDLTTQLPDTIPPGAYRLRFDYGISAAGRLYSLNNEKFAIRSAYASISHAYSPLIRVSGYNTSGDYVDATGLTLRLPWVLLDGYNSNGYSGVVAEEDRHWFNISGRNLIQDDVILPLFDEAQERLTYNLEPHFLPELIDTRCNIQWDFRKGELAVRITEPDGTVTDLGKAPVAGKNGYWATTQDVRFTNWSPRQYGKYTVQVTGFVTDIHGNKYVGGGNYTFWIGKRMTMATATFQGMAYPVGSTYGRDMSFAPAIPADVTVTATLFPSSDVHAARTVVSSGTASRSGIFGVAQGLKTLPLNTPGEYAAHILATYTDRAGHLWVCSMRHAGIVYPADSPVIARGKKMYLRGEFLDRGETHTEGVANDDDLPKPRSAEGGFLNFPWHAGDVLLIASSQNRANYINPVLTAWRAEEDAGQYDRRLSELGATNLRIRTSNGLSPHLFPEFITDWEYYYAAAPRPGFMGRFLVAEDGLADPDRDAKREGPGWYTGPTTFGGQVGASANGDLPGDIYRLIGGVVVRRAGATAVYAGYLASAFLLPEKTNNNRVISAGSEPVIGPDGTKARAWLVGTRPGMLYETGTGFRPAVQIDPILPAAISFRLRYPDGRTRTTKGTCDAAGSFVGPESWVLDIPGVYEFTIRGEWEGYPARMPGLPQNGGHFYVMEAHHPIDSPELTLQLPAESVFPVDSGCNICGSTTARTVHYAALMAGAVIAQGEVSVNHGRFCYHFDPAGVNKALPIYDTVNRVAFWPELKRIVHLSFFSKERTEDGRVSHSFARVIFRGNRVLYTGSAR